MLWGFALGWAMLAVFSVRFTDQPQRWAWAPAVFMGVSGLVLVAFGSGVNDALRWVWPPALLALRSGCVCKPTGTCVAALVGGCSTR